MKINQYNDEIYPKKQEKEYNQNEKRKRIEKIIQNFPKKNF